MLPKPSPDPKSSMWAWLAHDLRFYRNQRGVSGDSVAKLINCARSSLSRLENGEAKLDEGQAATPDERRLYGISRRGKIPSAPEVRSYVLRYDRIGQKALPEDLSRDLIKKVMETTK